MRPGSRIAWKLILVFAAILILVVVAGAWFRDLLDTAILAGAALVVTVGSIWLLTNHLVDRPIEALMAGMRKLREGDLGFRFEIDPRNEFAPVAEAFNVMAEQLQSTLDELRETRDYFEGIVENSADIIVTVSPSGYVYTFNRGAERALGYTPEEMIGRRVDSLFADPDERIDAIERLRVSDCVENYETHLRTKDGEIREVMLTLSRLRDPEGHTIGSFGIAKDVTDANLLRKKLVQSEKLAAIGQALAGIQHALKNMLNALKGGAYMVKLGLQKEDRGLLDEGWEMVRGGIDNLTSMSKHMLSYVREWKPQFDWVDVAGIAREIEAMFRKTAEGRGVAVRFEIADDPPRVFCDAKLLHSVLMDILSNALDACMEKEYGGGETPEIVLRANPSETGETFVLSVRDNGCGMTEKVRKNVFAPFFSTKKSWGTGLGLALTARTIRHHGGEIEVESEANVGSEFRIIVPVGGPSEGKEEPDGQEGDGGG